MSGMHFVWRHLHILCRSTTLVSGICCQSGCSSCSNFWQCNSCTLGYYSIAGICLDYCASGSCTSLTATALIDVVFDTFLGSYSGFVTGANLILTILLIILTQMTQYLFTTEDFTSLQQLASIIHRCSWHIPSPSVYGPCRPPGISSPKAAKLP